MYVKDVESYVPRPLRELVSYHKVLLEPNETKTVTMTVNKDAFSVYNVNYHEFMVESGTFDIEVCRNAEDVVLSETIEYNASRPFITNLSLQHPLKNFYIHKQSQTEALLNKYKKFAWHEIEEPALRVLNRLKKDFKISDSDFEELLINLMK